jgi:hypothetical protein
MRLASMESNPIYVFAPPLAQFECDCGTTVTLTWPRKNSGDHAGRGTRGVGRSPAA